MSALERWEAKVDKTGDCWLWTSSLSDRGYGRFTVEGRQLQAHRWAYEHFIGPIPEGLTIDHVCHTRALGKTCNGGPSCLHRRCVNPAHLEPVSQFENYHRGARALPRTHCMKGHEYTPENTVMDRGARHCRICRNASALAHYYAKKKRKAA